MLWTSRNTPYRSPSLRACEHLPYLSPFHNSLTHATQSAAMVLAAALVSAESTQSSSYDDGSHNIPQIPLHIARQIMTRADFIKSYDHINLFTITSTAHVRADSVPMQRAFRSICSEPGFSSHLEATLQRISDIESLGRTREIVAKDLVLGGRYVSFFFFLFWERFYGKGNADEIQV
jgi:hypothetical protein